ncbi:MAG: fumarylacetoacetate hydrolase family protein [Bacteroidota bacterium]
MPKILCIGRNYAEHAKEMKADVPTDPVFFLKPRTALIANGGSIEIPSISKDVHHEVEMTVLIGTGGRNIPEGQARRHIAGLGVGLDMTLRDVQSEAKKKGLPWTLAKGFDTSAPVSTFVPAAQVPDVSALEVELKVNGHVRQHGFLRDLLFPVEHLISYLSRFITLEEGDVIFTGTPEGVAQVVPGDRLEASLLVGGDRTPLARLTVSVR